VIARLQHRPDSRNLPRFIGDEMNKHFRPIENETAAA
jgi:hypothetical protein